MPMPAEQQIEAEEQARLNAELVEAIHGRQQRQVLHGYGIRTADEHLCGVIDSLEDPECADAIGAGSLPRIDRASTIKDAEQRLTYANEDMAYSKPLTAQCDIADYCKSKGIEPPPRTLMIFENVITTPTKDRDGDILRTEGAIVDPAMPLLWHHMIAAPIGKMIKVLKHNSKMLKVATAVIDSAMGHDVAALVEFGALRISHGFRPLKYERLERKEEGEWPGFDIQEFEIMEESVVSVPSNTDAVILAYSKGKLCNPLVKGWAKRIHDSRPLRLSGITIPFTVEVTMVDTDGKRIKSADDWQKDLLLEWESGESIEWSKPLPNEHSCRLKNPDDFKPDSFRRVKRKHEGKEYSVIMGKLHGRSAMTEQAYRYPKDSWKSSDAKKHCKDHHGMMFEPARDAEPEDPKQEDRVGHEAEMQAMREACERMKRSMEGMSKDMDAMEAAIKRMEQGSSHEEEHEGEDHSGTAVSQQSAGSLAAKLVGLLRLATADDAAVLRLCGDAICRRLEEIERAKREATLRTFFDQVNR